MHCIYLLCTCKYLTDAHVQYSEKCQKHIFHESSYANTQKCQIHLLEECLHANMQKSVKCIYLVNTQMHMQKSQYIYICRMHIEYLHICTKVIITNAHIEYAEQCQMHIFDESSYANTHNKKCQMYRTDNCLHEVSNAFNKYLYANMQKCQNDKH